MFHIGTVQLAFGEPTIPIALTGLQLLQMSLWLIPCIPGPLRSRAVAVRMGLCLERAVFRFVVPSVYWLVG
jgi:hypothetical protein